MIKNRYGQPGDYLWVREAFYVVSPRNVDYGVGYRADHPTGSLKDTDGGYSFRSYPNFGESFSDNEKKAWVEKRASADRWIPARFMPRFVSRISLQITGVREEQLQDITEADALAEGSEVWSLSQQDVDDIQISDESPEMKAFAAALGPGTMPARAEYRMLWDSINKGNGDRWDDNPRILVVEFKRVPLISVDQPAKPMPFKAEMIRAVLADKKTQTRRIQRGVA